MNGSKCLNAALLRGLLEVIGSFPGTPAVLCPGDPGGYPGRDEPVYRQLQAIVRDYAKSNKNLMVLPSLTMRAYIDIVANSRLVIGPDTSSQHIAATFGVPSISCYPSDSGYRYYYWGQLGKTAFCFRSPPETRRHVAAFCRLIFYLAHKLAGYECDSIAVPPTMLRRRVISSCLDELHGAWDALAEQDVPCKRKRDRAKSLVLSLRSGIAPAWQPHLMREIEQITAELCGSDQERRGEARRIYLSLRQDFFAIKALRMLVDLPH